MQPGLGVDVSLVPFFRASSAWLKGRIFDAKTKEITNISYLLQNGYILWSVIWEKMKAWHHSKDQVYHDGRV